MLSLIGGASCVNTNNNLSRNAEGVEKNHLCTQKQFQIRFSFVSLFGGHIVLFPFLSTAMCVQDNPLPLMLSCAAGTFLIPVSCTDTGLVPGPSVTRRHVWCHVSCVQPWPRFLRILILKLGLLLISAADTADSPLDLVPPPTPPLCLLFPLFRHVSGV